MSDASVNVAWCIGLGIAAWLVNATLYYAWSNAFVVGSWTGIVGYVGFGHLLDWLFPFTLFALVGVAVAFLVRSEKPHRWAVALGAIYGAISLAFQLYFSQQISEADLRGASGLQIDYVARLVPALGAWLGALAVKKLRSKT